MSRNSETLVNYESSACISTLALETTCPHVGVTEYGSGLNLRHLMRGGGLYDIRCASHNRLGVLNIVL